ncbi:MAG: hypothetical protein ACO1N7_03235, partial [Sphingobacteriaceae bacterium]
IEYRKLIYSYSLISSKTTRMKYLILISVLIILAACQTNSATAERHTTDVQLNFKAIINGNWVEPTYIDDLAKTKSPYKSQNALNSIVELNIDTIGIKGDSLEIGSPSVHEGGSFFVFFRPGIMANSFPTTLKDYDNESNFYELGYLISSKDTAVVIYHYNQNKKLIGQSEYKKVPENSEGTLQYMVNKTLVSGKYQATDTTGRSTTVRLTNDGKVIGLPSFSNYYVLTDFEAGPENNLDEICFNIHSNNQKCYAYEIKGDTINLYETIENEDHKTLTFGQQKYKLVKQ